MMKTNGPNDEKVKNLWSAIMFALFAANDVTYNATSDFLNSIPASLQRNEVKHRINLVRKDAHTYWRNFRQVAGKSAEYCTDIIDEIEEDIEVPMFQLYNALLFRLQKEKYPYAEALAKGEVARIMAKTAYNFASDVINVHHLSFFRHIASTRLSASVEQLEKQLYKVIGHIVPVSFNEPDAGQEFSSIQMAYDKVLHTLANLEAIMARIVERENKIYPYE